MNQDDINWKKINDVKREYLDLTCQAKLHVNCIKLVRGDKHKKHELTVRDICTELFFGGSNFIIRPTLKNGKEPDILVIPNGFGDPYIIEVQNTESDESIKIKKGDYPLPVEVVKT